LAALTNYYGPNEYVRGKLSRGWLISGFLNRNLTSYEYLQLLRNTGDRYNGFSLVFGDDMGLSYYSNRGEPLARISRGVHGLSNHLLDTPWPKVSAAKAGLRRILGDDVIDPEKIFKLLSDPTRYPEHLLPDTGVDMERERALSPVFVSLSEFGTRCSTVILVDRENRMTFIERSFDSRQRTTGDVRYSLALTRTTALERNQESPFDDHQKIQEV
jgi:uncharacterized protein with NRDE domain